MDYLKKFRTLYDEIKRLNRLKIKKFQMLRINNIHRGDSQKTKK